MQAPAHVTLYVSLVLIILSMVAAAFFNPQVRLKQVNTTHREPREVSSLLFGNLFSAQGVNGDKLNALIQVLKSHDLRAELDIFFMDAEPPLSSSHSDIRVAYSRSRHLTDLLVKRGVPPDAFEIYLTRGSEKTSAQMRAILRADE